MKVTPRSLGARPLKCRSWAFNQNWHKQGVSWGYSNINIHSDKQPPSSPAPQVLCKQIKTTDLKQVTKRPVGQEPSQLQYLENTLISHF